MKIAVIADIHGNADALAAVLTDIRARGIGTTLNLGDSLSGPLDPAGTADQLIAAGIASISGNHDHPLVRVPPEKQGLWEQWTYPELTPAHLDWIRELPATRVVGEVLMTHGTPQSDSEDWLHKRSATRFREATAEEVAAPAQGFDHPVVLCAHTHGSVGVPAYRDTRFDPPFVMESGKPDARYAVLEKGADGWEVDFIGVAYDSRRMAARARALGQESWAQALETGRVT